MIYQNQLVFWIRLPKTDLTMALNSCKLPQEQYSLLLILE